MAIPDYQFLMLPVLLASSAGEVRIGTIVEKLAAQLGLSPEDRNELLPSGKQTIFSNRVQWAKSYLNKAGLIEITRRGHFQITTRGRELIASNPAQIDNKLLMQFEEFRKFKDRSGRSGGESGEIPLPALEDQQTPDESMRTAHEQIDSALAQDLLERIYEAPPDFFERLIVTLLLNMGYGGSKENAGRILGQSGDGGVDGVVDQDALGLDRLYIQAKRYKPGNNVGSGAIRDFFGSLDRHKAAKGLFVTTSDFSTAAKETADLLSKRIVLIDGEKLARLMIRHNVGCRIVETLYVKRIDEDFFDL